MKTTHKTFQRFVASALAMAILGIAASASAQMIERSALIIKVSGDNAQISTDGEKTWHTAMKGDQLKAGDSIQTGPATQVTMRLGEQPVGNAAARVSNRIGASTAAYNPEASDLNLVLVYENSHLAIQKLIEEGSGADKSSTTELDLKAGKILGNVKKLSASSKYEIKLPNGVAGIRGTLYVIGSDGTLTVLEGSVVISYQATPGGPVVTQEVTFGNSFNLFTPNVPPTPTPVALAQQYSTDNSIAVAGATAYAGPTTVTQDTTVVYISPK